MNKQENSIEKWKKEIIETELAFAQMAQKEGISKAFLTYAAEDAVLMRNNSLIIGMESIRESFNNQKTELGSVSLTWKPDFVDVASSGDLGYTYGKYVYTVIDSTGNEKTDTGIFHTVWKRQPDGKWKFVWD
jgi:ketosteroid isomerase-like protein